MPKPGFSTGYCLLTTGYSLFYCLLCTVNYLLSTALLPQQNEEPQLGLVVRLDQADVGGLGRAEALHAHEHFAVAAAGNVVQMTFLAQFVGFARRVDLFLAQAKQILAAKDNFP